MEIAFCEVYAFLQSAVNSEKALPLIHLFRRIDKNLFFILASLMRRNTSQKMKFAIKDFFSMSVEIRNFIHIWSHLPKKSLIENFIFCVWRQAGWTLVFKVILDLNTLNSSDFTFWTSLTGFHEVLKLRKQHPIHLHNLQNLKNNPLLTGMSNASGVANIFAKYLELLFRCTAKNMNFENGSLYSTKIKSIYICIHIRKKKYYDVYVKYPEYPWYSVLRNFLVLVEHSDKKMLRTKTFR